MKRFFSILATSFCMATMVAQTQIQDYQPGVTPEGAIYFLPKTALRIDLLVEKTTYKPGDFSAYAQRYMRLNDVKQEANTQYRIINIKMTPVGVADSSKSYALKFNPKSVAAHVALAEDGRLLAINAEPKTLQTPTPFEPCQKKKRLDPRQLMSQEILSAGSTAKMAELTAREIYDLRENRNLLIKGQADFMPKDGEQLRLMLNQLDEQDAALTSLFKGVYDCDTTEHTITFCPEGPVKHQLLFRLSQVNGLVDADDLSGAPFYITVEDLNTVPPVDEEAAAKVKKKKVYEAGVYVNIPGRMRISLFQGINNILTTEQPAPQFGNVELLSGELFNRRYSAQLWLNPVTGAIDKFTSVQPEK